MQRVHLEPGLIDRIKAKHNFSSDAQLAAVLRCSAEELDALRSGAEPSMITLVAIANVTGVKSLSFAEIGEPAA